MNPVPFRTLKHSAVVTVVRKALLLDGENSSSATSDAKRRTIQSPAGYEDFFLGVLPRWTSEIHYYEPNDIN